MKHRLMLLLALPLLAACGSASGHTGGGGGSSAAPEGYRVLSLVSAPNGGGTPTTLLTWLQDDDAASQYAAQFRPGLQGKLHQALAAPDVPAGEALFAAVVAVGCDVPTQVSAEAGMTGPEVSVSPVATPKPNCVAPITTVAIVAGPTP